MRILDCINLLSHHPFLNVILVAEEQQRVIESYEELAIWGLHSCVCFLEMGEQSTPKEKKKSKSKSTKKTNQNNPPQLQKKGPQETVIFPLS